MIAAAAGRAYPLRFAWQEPLDDGGRRLLLITDGTLALWSDLVGLPGGPEAFMLIEMRIPLSCEGEGKIGISLRRQENEPDIREWRAR